MQPETEIVYWPRSFVMRSRNFVQRKPYQRISTTLICQPGGLLRIATEDRGELECQAIVLGPSAHRLSLELGPEPAFLIETQPLSSEHQSLLAFLRYQPTRVVDGDALEALSAELSLAPAELDESSGRDLHARAIAAVAPAMSAPVADERILQVLGWLQDSLLEEVSLTALAARAGLSESRLRSLARKTLGCSLSQYVRWLAAWRIAEFWRPGATLTDAAHAAGFHDLAHANRATNEMFGMSPSRVFKASSVRLINGC